MATTGEWDLVCCGHSHHARIAAVQNVRGGTTPVINPGTVGGVGGAPATYVMGDLEHMRFDVHEISGSVEQAGVREAG
jgi:hypothetical protein